MIVIQFNVKKFVKWDKESDFFPRKKGKKEKKGNWEMFISQQVIHKKNILITHIPLMVSYN